MTEDIKKQTPAYATYKSFTNLIADLRETGIPPHIQRSVVKGSNSGKSTMLASLKYLGLMSADLSPTLAFTQLIESEENYTVNLKNMLLNSYPFLFDGSIDVANTTTEKVIEKFKVAGARGSTISKCMAFFITAAKEAGITIHSRVKAPTPTRTNGGQKKSKKTKVVETNDNNSFDDDLGVPEGMERITVPLRNMEDGVIFFPPDLEEDDARKAVKMAIFILNNFYGLDEEA